MTDSGYNYHEIENGVPLKVWSKGVTVEDSAMQQLKNVASLPFIHKHVAAMPDAHWGMGSTIGSVIATHKAIIPAAVGVDIGCGMTALRTTLTGSELPDNLKALRTEIEAAVPHGRTDHGGRNDVGRWRDDIPDLVQERWKILGPRFDYLKNLHPKAIANNNIGHLGTLGTGNHFIEICLDEEDRVWAMLHSGSRGCGNRIGMYFINKAKKEMEKWYIHLPDANLAYLPEGSELFKDYIFGVIWAQDFAFFNREIMMTNVMRAMENVLPKFDITRGAVNCHHNYVEKEHHFGKNVWVTRKGAVRAREGDLGIIPGSMGTKSYIVRGKGNADSFNSCSHGAGRRMSRTKAKEIFSIKDHEAATEGVECRKDISVLDETPMAYKDIDAVMAAQTDLVEVVHTLKQVVCVKG